MDKNIVWTEKYRPSNISKIVQQDIKQLILSKNDLTNLPHLLFYGPPGTGKTTTALAICKHIFTPNHMNNKKIFNERVLELNASDERGIKVVREKIKTFAAQALNNYEGIPFFKIIILDEADVMTNDSQFALRRIIEQYSHITRFILICNYVTKIIPPLSSRCSRYRFNQITLNSMKIIIENILNKENIYYDTSNIDDIVLCIYNYSNGDLRKAITLLQRAVYISNINDEPLNCNIINDISGRIPNEDIKTLFNILMSKDNIYNKLSLYIISILNNGYASADILDSMSNIIMTNNNICDSKKSKIFIKMSNISNLLSNGSGDYIQLLTICSYINFVVTH